MDSINRMNTPQISIIILNYKTYGLLRHCVHSIIQFSSVATEIIVVDAVSDQKKLSAISDELTRACALHGGSITYRAISLPDNQGFARANNRAIKQATGKYIMILNADTLVFEQTIPGLVAYLDSHKDVGIIGPLVTNPDGTRQDSCFRFPEMPYPLYRRTFLSKTKRGTEWLQWFLMRDVDFSEPRAVDWMMGVCLVSRAEALADVGLLDERFFLFLEDTDWCYRFWQHGWKVVYNPMVHIVHYPMRASSEKTLLKHVFKKTAWIHLLSWYKYYMKHMVGNAKYKRSGR